MLFRYSTIFPSQGIPDNAMTMGFAFFSDFVAAVIFIDVHEQQYAWPLDISGGSCGASARFSSFLKASFVLKTV